ncbi:MAG: hypothetical protein CSA04_05100 [Bacteroidetes bacterium]|nr:MAG: hypothetical protein CSA04_05100 [Bacteroidota bacterium]
MTVMNSMDKMFRDAAKRSREYPPQGAWGGIASSLGAARRRRMYLLLSGGAAVVILLLGFGVGYWYRSVMEEVPQWAEQGQGSPVEDLSAMDTRAFREASTVPVLAAEGAMDQARQMDRRSPMFVREKRMVEPSAYGEAHKWGGFRHGDAVAEVEADVASASFKPWEEAAIRFPAGKGVMESRGAELPASELSAMATAMALDNVLVKKGQLEELLTHVPHNTYSSGSGSQALFHDKLPAVKSKSKAAGEWALTGDLAAAYAFRAVALEEGSLRKSSPLIEEQGVASWNAGIYAINQLSSTLKIKAGVSWASYGQGSQNLYVYQDGSFFQINSSLGRIATDLYPAKEGGGPLPGTLFMNDLTPVMLDDRVIFGGKRQGADDLVLTQRFDYLEFPFLLQFVLRRTRGFSLLTEAGLYAGVLTGNRVFLSGAEERYLVGYTEGLRPLSLGGVAGVGVGYTLSRSLSMEVVPRLRYALLSISKMPEISYRPYQFGLGVGLTYHF